MKNMTQQMLIKTTKILKPIPQNHVPDFFSMAVTTDPASKCRILTVAIGATISGIIDPGSGVSTIFVPQSLWDAILNHAVPFRLCIDYTLLADGTLRVDNVSIQAVVPSLLLSVQTQLESILQDAAETTSAGNNLLGLVNDALAVESALVQQDLDGRRHQRISDVAPTMIDAPQKFKQVK
jgi:hypothetical protein